MNEALQVMFGEQAGDGKQLIICNEIDKDIISVIKVLQDTVACYTFSIITSGRLTLCYDGRVYHLTAGDFYIHSPEVPYEMLEATEDFRAYLFAVDLSLALSPEIMQGVSSYIGMRLSVPRLPLPSDVARRIADLMCLAMHYYRSDLPFRDRTLREFLHLMLLEITSLKEPPVMVSRFSPRVEDLFLRFLRLLSQSWLEHRDLAFYADSLCISTTYLSRLVRRVSGRTVQDFINSLLLIEASRLLLHTSLSIAQIADRLHFAETSSFVRFFRRMRGVSPTCYREQNSL